VLHTRLTLYLVCSGIVSWPALRAERYCERVAAHKGVALPRRQRGHLWSKKSRRASRVVEGTEKHHETFRVRARPDGERQDGAEADEAKLEQPHAVAI